MRGCADGCLRLYCCVMFLPGDGGAFVQFCGYGVCCGGRGDDCDLGGGGSCSLGIIGGIIGPKPGGRFPIGGMSECGRGFDGVSLCGVRPRDTPDIGADGGQEGCCVGCSESGVCVVSRLA